LATVTLSSPSAPSRYTEIRMSVGRPDLTTDLDGLLSMPEIREAAGWFAANKAWLQEQQIAVCRVPAPTFLEEQRAEHMRALFTTLGYQSRIDPAGNTIASLRLDSKAPVVVLSAHLDTVLSPRRPSDIQVEPDGTLRGPGVADNGSGLAALLALASVLRNLKQFGWPYDLLFVANVGEEGEGNLTGMRYLCTDSDFAGRIAGVLVLDGPGHERITCRALASRRYELLFQGRGGHSWSDFGTVNPVHALARATALFADSNNPIRNQFAERYSLNIGVIHGGTTVNSIPQSATAKVDIRSENESIIDALSRSLGRCVEQAVNIEHQQATRGRLTARVREIGSRPGGRLPDDSPLLSASYAVDRQLGIASVLDISSTDANIPLSLGIPSISIGTGGSGAGAHTTEEWYRPDNRDLGLRRAYFILCAMLCGIALPSTK
jgi:tripeptide aminopeptidase